MLHLNSIFLDEVFLIKYSNETISSINKLSNADFNLYINKIYNNLLIDIEE